ncbi:sphingomyelin phosphodiesterase 5 [Cebus imitator]|uniref:sphingomyelin phosphodiesterase 5 n=1 Tax=Cebus imitator TaxID=2715852 RepID=UPI0018983F69|nr:sphingomyelin phosphodiesterase 5 [Cebus imitator]
MDPWGLGSNGNLSATSKESQNQEGAPTPRGCRESVVGGVDSALGELECAAYSVLTCVGASTGEERTLLLTCAAPPALKNGRGPRGAGCSRSPCAFAAAEVPRGFGVGGFAKRKRRATQARASPRALCTGCATWPSPLDSSAPPAPGALRPSPFPHPALHGLHRLARALLFPAYWTLDQLLGCCAPTARPMSLGRLRRAARGFAALLLLLLVGLPLALPGLLLWLWLQVWRRPFCYRPPPLCWAPPAPWRPPAEPGRCFAFLTADLCLLPDGLARFSNLPHSQRRAEAIGAALLAGLRPPLYRATDCTQPWPRAPRGALVASLPVGLDFVCLQEVFDLRAARRLVNRLAPNLGPVLYDVGTFGLQPGPHLKLLGSGLLLASRYPLLRAAFRCFPHARGEDALASKGLLSAQAQLGCLDGRRIVGFLHCTHLQAPAEDGPLRSKQLTLMLDWAEQFEAQSDQSGEVVAFSVLLGNLNFDNCSKDHALEQEHELFSRFQDPCRLGTRQEQPWALGTILSTSVLHHSVACSPEMLRRALEQEKGRHLYLAGHPCRSLRAKPWRGRRLDYITYCGVPGGLLRPEVQQVMFSTALAGLTDHLVVGLQLRVSAS